MKAVKILMVITALVVVVGVTSDAWAQCAQPRLFRSAGKGGNNVDVDVSAIDPAHTEIGRFWDSDNANFSNNGLSGPNFGNLCPSPLWFNPRGTAGNWAIDAFLTEGACAQQGCPADKLTAVIEAYDFDGPPGINGTAYYIGWMTDETPVDTRWYNYGDVDGATTATVLPMVPFPDVFVINSARVPASADVDIVYQLASQTPNNHTWDHGAGVEFPTSDVVSEWHLMQYRGIGDPGRLRSHWTKVQTIPYPVPTGDSGTLTYRVPCPSVGEDTYLAAGVGFNGGSAGVIDSALVGRAIQIECNPNLAQPDEQFGNRKPTATELGAPGRSGGRR